MTSEDFGKNLHKVIFHTVVLDDQGFQSYLIIIHLTWPGIDFNHENWLDVRFEVFYANNFILFEMRYLKGIKNVWSQ